MNALRLDRRLLLPRPGRTLLRASLGFTFPVLYFLIMRLRVHDASLDIYILLFGVAQVAVALATGHKEILAATSSFFRPGLRAQLCAAQLIGAAITGLATVAVGLAVFPQPDVATLATAFSMSVAVYAAMTLLTLHLRWSYQFTMWMMLLTPLVAKLVGRNRDAAVPDLLARPLAHPLPWLLGSVVLVSLLARSLSGRSLQRRLSGMMVLGFEDMFSASRVRTLYELQGRNARHGRGPRWRSALLAFALTRAAAARGPGREADLRAWLLAHAGAALTISPRRRIVALYGASIAGLVVFGGYYDNWLLHNDDKGLFAGMGYSFAAMPLVGICNAMNARVSFPSSRRTGFRSELTALGGAVGVTVVLSCALWAVFGVLAANLPPLSWAGRVLTFTPPALHLNWLMPLLAPFMWLGVALRPRPNSNLPSAMMTGAFLTGYNMILFYPNTGALLIGLVLAAVAGIAAFERRRRWWQRADLSV